MAIDEKKLIKDLHKWVVDNERGADDLSVFIGDCHDAFLDIINAQPKLDVPDINVGKWIPCSQELPNERDSFFARLKGTDRWIDGMFEKISDDVIVTVKFGDGTRKTMTMHTVDGSWKYPTYLPCEVLAWMPLPEAYKGEE